MQVILTEEEYEALKVNKKESREIELTNEIKELHETIKLLTNKVVRVQEEAEHFNELMVIIKLPLEDLPEWIKDDIKVRMSMGMIK